jgi:MSHA biogenesis protein MshK
MTRAAVAALAFSFAPLALAQGMSDPTRPPSAAAADGRGEAAGETATSQFQSILISPGRKLAVINGQTVALGGRIGDATLAKITETGVVLKRGDALESLALLPGVDKKRRGARAVRAGEIK